MIDYLELVFQAGENALREAELRLAAALAGWPGGGGLEEGAEEINKIPPGPPADGGGRRPEERPMEPAVFTEKRQEHYPLQAILKAMDRSVIEIGYARTPEQRSGLADARQHREPHGDMSGEGWNPYPVSGRKGGVGQAEEWTGRLADPAPAGAEAQDLAERVDRAFQRDGRRYDGGFFLY